MKIKYFIVFVALAVLAMPLSGYSSEQNQGQSQPCPAGGTGTQCMERFKTMDTDHDGAVTLEEFTTVPHHRGYPEQIFKSRDINGDGSLTQEEFCSTRGMHKRMGK